MPAKRELAFLLQPMPRPRVPRSPRTRVHCQQQAIRRASSSTPDFAFAFDIDGVLCRSSEALPKASRALRTLRANNIPFILLTNGGGTSEQARVDQLSKILNTPISIDQFVQSHTPFSEFKYLKTRTALVMGGPQDGHSCREVASGYGFGTVVTPMDIYAAYPDIWPFGIPLHKVDKGFIRPLPKPLAFELGHVKDSSTRDNYLKIDAAFVFNDPRDWSMDATILLDTLLAHHGYIGTLSSKNGDLRFENRGYLKDGAPPVYFSNPDIWWAAKWRNPRLGQGAFKAAFEGMFKAATGGAVLNKVSQWGKPHQATYAFAEKKLVQQREQILGKSESALNGLRKVYMVGDNPESDIKGANRYSSHIGAQWDSILVKTGVYNGGKPMIIPSAIVAGVWDAVQHAFKQNCFEPKDLEPEDAASEDADV